MMCLCSTHSPPEIPISLKIKTWLPVVRSQLLLQLDYPHLIHSALANTLDMLLPKSSVFAVPSAQMTSLFPR